MNEEQREDSLTESEAEEVDAGTMDPEEAHRYGEFEELHRQIEEVSRKQDDILEGIKAIREGMGVFVENGAVITDIEPETLAGSVDATDGIEQIIPLEELDLTVEEND